MAKKTWQQLAAAQEGVAARAQLLARGCSAGTIRHELARGRWQQLRPGVVATFPGPVSTRARIWAAVLYCGEGAAAGHRTALWLAGVSDAVPDVIDVCIPASRRVRGQAGLRIRRRKGLAAAVHPALRPPRVRLETAVLDVAGGASSAEQAVDPVLRATQRRLTTAARLRAELARRPRHVRYRRFALIVELDGQEAHPPDEAFRDLPRDNLALAEGSVCARYGWRDVAERPCLVAAQVAAALTHRGWTGTPHPCGPHCPLSGQDGNLV